MTTHAIHRLNDNEVKAFTDPGRLHDGGNLYFYANERGGRSWEYRFEPQWQAQDLGPWRLSRNHVEQSPRAAQGRASRSRAPASIRSMPAKRTSRSPPHRSR